MGRSKHNGQTVALQFPDKDAIALQLGSGYKPIEAFKELVSNSLDGIQEVKVIQPEYFGQVNIELYPPRGRGLGKVTVVDNGVGMIYSDLEGILTQAGVSEKKDRSDLIGEKHIAFLAFQSFAGRQTIYSRKMDTANTFCLDMQRGKVGSGSVLWKNEKGEKNVFPYGTRVEIQQIPSAVYKKSFSNPVLLEESLAGFFGSFIREGFCKIDITYPIRAGRTTRRETRTVKPIRFSNYIKICGASTPSQRVELYIDPRGSASGVQVLQKRVRTCSLTDLDEFKEEPWNSKYLFGEITNERSTLTQLRNRYVPDDTYFGWVDFVQTLGPKVTAALEDFHSTQFKKKTNEISIPYSKGKRGRKKGSRSVPPSASGKPATRTIVTPIITEEEPRNTNLRSALEDGVIKINPFHPDYITEARSSKIRSTRYVAMAATKTIIVDLYGDLGPELVSEKTIEFYLHLFRHLKIR